MKKFCLCTLCILLATVFFSGCGDGNPDTLPETSIESSTETPAESLPKTTDFSETPMSKREPIIPNDLESNCKLIVTGKDISQKSYVYMHFDKKYVELPLITILDELGASVDWKNDNEVHFEFADKTYILYIWEDALYEQGDTMSLLMPAPGDPGGQYVRIIENEYMINDSCIKLLMFELGFNIKMDFDQATVYIEEK